MFPIVPVGSTSDQPACSSSPQQSNPRSMNDAQGSAIEFLDLPQPSRKCFAACFGSPQVSAALAHTKSDLNAMREYSATHGSAVLVASDELLATGATARDVLERHMDKPEIGHSEPMSIDGINDTISASGHEWQHLRALHPLITIDVGAWLSDLYGIVRKNTERWLAKQILSGRIKDSGTVSLQNSIQKLYFETISLMLFGMSEPPGMPTYTEYEHVLHSCASSGWGEVPSTEAAEEETKTQIRDNMLKFCLEMIQISIQNPTALAQTCLVSQLVSIMPKAAVGTENVKIAHQLASFYGHGLVASSVAVVSVITGMARADNEARTAARNEIDALPNEHTYNQLQECKAITRAVSEALRLSCPVPCTSRQLSNDDTLSRCPHLDRTRSCSWAESISTPLSSVRVPEGTTATLSCQKDHLDSHHWGVTAANFETSRWVDEFLEQHDLNSNNESVHFWPFGKGARQCVGQELAIFFVKTCLAVLLKQAKCRLEGHWKTTYILGVVAPGVSPFAVWGNRDDQEFVETTEVGSRDAGNRGSTSSCVSRLCDFVTSTVLDKFSTVYEMDPHAFPLLERSGNYAKYSHWEIVESIHQSDVPHPLLEILDEFTISTIGLAQMTVPYSNEEVASDDLTNYGPCLPACKLQRNVCLDFGGICFTDCDEDEGTVESDATSMLFQAFTRLSLSAKGFDDLTPYYFPPGIEGPMFCEQVFGPHLPRQFCKWENLKSDEEMSKLAFWGLPSYYLASVTAQDRAPLGPLQNNEVAYLIDLSFLYRFEVRPGLEPYGAIAYFNKDRSIYGIWWCHLKQLVMPHEELWERAKLIWRSTFITEITLKDHLLYDHMIIANGLMLASRECLADDHPLRRLLKPHTYRTASINQQAYHVLIPVGGLAHRCFGFTSKSWLQLYDTMCAEFKYEPFPERVKRMNLPNELRSELPVCHDGLKLWDAIQKYVTSICGLVGDVTQDPDIQNFWNHFQVIQLNRSFGLPELSFESLVELLTHCIFSVSGLHELVGSIVQYLTLPNGFISKVHKSAECGDIQTFCQQLSIITFTGMKQPPLMGDSSYFYESATGSLARDNGETAKGFFREFINDLKALSDQIDEMNKTRVHPAMYFNPRILEAAVSI